MNMVEKERLGESKNYTVWTTENACGVIFLRDRTHPTQKEQGDARSPDLFFDSIEQIEELITVLKMTVRIHGFICSKFKYGDSK